ncbi:hypothetical protein [Endozoicomonas sp. SESOKO1]|uniref:hypothetical protein n=1 Tax=Endozoicomonas sp. SESOKO1 TaxID=2828742 RepID=UPI0021473547|nr:hypothetical protein [Endozoicomonas sp. SESOKO1]
MSGSQLIFTGESRDGIDQDGEEYTEFDYEYAPLGNVSSSAPSMGLHPIIQQYQTGGLMSQAQAAAIQNGGMDYEFRNYGMSEAEIQMTKSSLMGKITQGSIKLI